MKQTCLIYGMPVIMFPFGYDEEDIRCIQIKIKLAEITAQLAYNGITDFVSDCEYGVSLWGAEIILAQKIYLPNISLKIYIPKEEQAVKWTPNWRKRYFDILSKADHSIMYNNPIKCITELISDSDILIYVGTYELPFVKNFRKQGKLYIISI